MWGRAGVNKFHARRTVVDGIRFDSRAEAVRYQELRLLERYGDVRELRMQVPFPLVVNGVKVATYRADFAYVDRDGQEVIEDVKGVRTPVYALKKRLMAACHGVEIVEIGQTKSKRPDRKRRLRPDLKSER